VTVVVAAVAGGSFTVAKATPSSGMERSRLSRASATGDAPTVQFQTGTETEVVKLVLQPGGTTGWHRHPVQGMFLVDKGTFTSYGLDGPPCDPVDIPAGKAVFLGPHAHHAHLVQNRGSEPLEITVLYFNLALEQRGAVDAHRPKECPADLN
jgi:quercetin dioxygenase-like cupin family protein